ncbi:MAG: DHA2 family efflux MFS transporter permease subunit [Steroidobacteraceae bacterium]
MTEPIRPEEIAHRGMITLSIMLATVIQAIDGTIANVALPHMQGNLSASQDQIAWVLTSYIIAAAIATPLTGWLTDRFGLKSVFLVSIAGFTAASVLCGLADSLAQIVLARTLQGFLGAALVPLSQAVLLDINPPRQHGQAMAMWGVGVMVGPILGPTLGGWLTDTWSWRWVFFINVPIGALAFYGVGRYILRRAPLRRQRFDLFGFVTLSLALGALQLLLDRGQTNDWFAADESWVELVVMLASFAYFVAHTALTPAGRSFFDYRLLRNSNYVSGAVLIFFVGAILFATRALIPTMLQTLFDYPVTLAGLVTAPSGIGTMLAMLVVGRLVGRLDVRLLVAAGFGVTALSLWQMTQYNLDITQSAIVWPGIIQGIGVGLVFVPLSAATFATLSPDMRAEGTAIYSLARNIGSAVGIALVQVLLVRNTQRAHAGLVANLTAANPDAHHGAAALAFNLAHTHDVALLDSLVTRQAEMIAYLDDFMFMLALTLLALPLLLLLRPTRAATPLAMDANALE